MAGTLTHHKIGEEIIKKIDFNIDKDLYLLSCQGHDLLFFIRLWEYPSFKKRKKLIKRLQDENFSLVVRLIEEEIIKTNDLHLKSFLYGYITHHITDSIFHPFIIYETGKYENTKETRKYQGKHALLESAIDANLYDNLSKVYIPKVRYSNELSVKLDDIFSKTYNTPKIGKIMVKNLNNVRHFIKFYRIDNMGIKKTFYKIVSKFLHEKYEYISYEYSKENYPVDFNYIYEWSNPVTKEKHKTSINDLYQKSINESFKVIKAIDNDLKKLKVSDINLDISAVHGGKTGVKYKLKYFKN